MGDWKSGLVYDPTIPVAKAVTASSAFPPVLSPCELDIPGRPPVYLTDGGVYDNLGLEPVYKNCKTVLVSDGGGGFSEPEKPPTDWLLGTVRVLEVIDVEVRRLRLRQVNDALAAHYRKGAFWAIRSERADFPAKAPALPCPPDKTKAIAAIPTRLAKLSKRDRQRIVNWGYAAADASMRSWVHEEKQTPAPSGFPYPETGLG